MESRLEKIFSMGVNIMSLAVVRKCNPNNISKPTTAAGHLLLQNMQHKNQCKILIVREEGWFGQPKYSTPTKKSFYVVSTSASIVFILYVKSIRSLLIQLTPAGSSFRLFA